MAYSTGNLPADNVSAAFGVGTLFPIWRTAWCTVTSPKKRWFGYRRLHRRILAAQRGWVVGDVEFNKVKSFWIPPIVCLGLFLVFSYSGDRDFLNLRWTFVDILRLAWWRTAGWPIFALFAKVGPFQGLTQAATLKGSWRTMKNRCIEIHDSTIDAISVRDKEVVLHFPRVYIHESTGAPGVVSGSGWVQEALLRIYDAVVTRTFSKFPADLLAGQIVLDDVVLSNIIPIPLEHKGIVELRLESWNDEAALITGSSAELELIGKAKYVEEFRP